MTPHELERAVISSIRTPADLRTCREAGITRASFVVTEPDYGAAYEYIESHARDHGGALPTDDDLRLLHGVERGKPGDLASYVAEMRRAEIARNARQILYQGAEMLESDPVAAVGEMSRRLADLRSLSARNLTFLDRDAEKRLAAFDEIVRARDAGEVIGIPTGLTQTFDRAGYGFKRGEVVVVMGMPGVGKSWLLMKFAVVAYEAGYRVLLISPEMSAEECGVRFDTLLSGEREERLTSSAIMRGEADRDFYAGWLRALSNRDDFLVVDTAEDARPLTFEDVWDLTMEHRPDAVYIDGLYLLTGRKVDADRQGWEELKRGVELLKSLALRAEVVVVGVHQVDRSGVRDGGSGRVARPPGLHQIGYGLSVAQTADRVISLGRSGSAVSRIFTVPKFRGGPEINEARALAWSVEYGKIFETGMPELPDGGDPGTGGW